MKSSWFRSLFRGVCPLVLFAVTTALAQTNSVPLVNQPLVPTAAAPGGASFTLTVNGTGFVSGSVVKWNGTALTTTFVSQSQLTAIVPASDIATASTASVTVSSPSPGGGTSNVLYFAVSAPTDLKFTSVPVTPPNECPVADGFECANFAVADFNRDGNLDLAVSVLGREDATETGPIFTTLGSGDGTFQAPGLSGGGGSFFAAADFNGDGKLDLLEVGDSGTAAPYAAAIQLGNGDGTFAAPTYITPLLESAINAGPSMVGDFNGDGKLDVAIGASDGLEVYLGNGDGTFRSVPPQSFNDDAIFLFTTVGDFNGDGKLDLVALVYPQYDLEVFLGNGDGTFQTPTTGYAVGTSTYEVIAADLNGDDKLDLITLQFGNGPTNTVTILLGNGDGTFRQGAIYQVSGSLNGGTIGDFNADGKLDVALPTSTNSVPSTTILLGNGDGTFQTPLVFPDPANVAIATGDFNNDGKPDLVIGTSNGVFLLLQDYTSDFSLTAGSKTSVTVTPGQTANYTINVVPGAGFTQTVSLACSGAPAQSTCTVSPGSVALNGKTVPVSVSVATTASTMGLTQTVNPSISGEVGAGIALSGFLGLLVMATLGGRHRRRRPQLALGVTLVCLLSIGLTMSACGGGNGNGGGGNGGTQAGTYTLTVTGTSGSGSSTLTQKMNLTLVVQ
ncbi:MAG TPA: VCBS repeat-containing protein [Terriglobales bacterium]|nr:VCBS repeat-containing protein [Terriglobales bacterium]